MIESVTVMESQMLACNLEKKKILAEMDKIDETKVKTKEMISRRRRLEVELQNQERKLEHIKSELKKMKVLWRFPVILLTFSSSRLLIMNKKWMQNISTF